MEEKSKYIDKGAGWLHLLFALLFFTMIATFLYMQLTGVAKGVDIQEYVQKNNLNEQKEVLNGTRGAIYTNDKVVLAEDVSSYDIHAVLTDKYSKGSKAAKHVTDKSKTAQALAPMLGMSVEEILTILNKEGNQVEFGSKGRNLTFKQKTEIDALKLPGISFTEGKKRYYPNGNFASHVVGFMTTKDDGSVSGGYGLESKLEAQLKSQDGKVSYKSDKQGFILPSVERNVTPPKNGEDVYLTIDSHVQAFVDNAMKDVMDKYKPDKAVAIVMDPKTGKILGMSSGPSFDPNKRDVTDFNNYAISSLEPGSTFKIFTLAAAINEGVYNGDATYQSGSYNAGGTTIRDHNKTGWGSITFNEGIQRSSNVGIDIIGEEKLGHEKAAEYFKRFKLFESTGIELGNEGKGKLQFNTPIERATTFFGQGSTTTPIQMVQAAGAIANGGKMMKPYIIDSIQNPTTHEIVEKHEPTAIGEPITKETAKQVLEILESVITSPKGTGKAFGIDGYSVAGKTGTAQIVDQATGKYMSGHGKYLLSFIGMAPKENPEVVVYVAVQNPKLKPDEAESQPTSEMFTSITKNTLQYLKVKPIVQQADKLVDKHSVSIPSFKDESLEVAQKQVTDLGLTPVIIGDGKKVISHEPKVDEQVIRGSKTFILTDGEIKMPDIVGWSINDVIRLCNLLNVEMEITGSGYVVQQSIPPGTVVNKADVLKVEYKLPKG